MKAKRLAVPGVILFAFSLSPLLDLHAGGITAYTAFKTASFHQIDSTQPLTVDAPNAYFFGAQFFADVPNDITNVTFTTPEGTNYSHVETNIYYVSYNSDYFASKADMDDWFPDGTYVYAINDGSQTGNLIIPAVELYPADVPFFTGNTWTNLQSLSPSNSINLMWNAFTPDEAATSAYVFIRILDEAAGSFVFTADFLPASTTAANIPAGTLRSGTSYRLELLFSNRSDSQNAGFGGAADATAGFDYLTYINFTTALPRLGLVRAGANIVLSWPVTANTFTLEFAHDLTAGGWNPVIGSTYVIGEQVVLTNAISSTNTFFRLRKPQ